MGKDVTIVSGLPRSGTSMMMRMLRAGGLDVVADDRREADEDNPHGYLEFEDVKKIKEDTSWMSLAEGKAVKMVSMLLYDLPRERNYRVIFMKRSLDEILASQRKMLERRGEGSDFNYQEMEMLFNNHLGEIEKWLSEQTNIQTLFVTYKDVLDAPVDASRRISHFLGGSLDLEKMVQVVDASLYRHRSRGDADVTGSSQAGGSDLKSSPSEKEKIESQLRALGYM